MNRITTNYKKKIIKLGRFLYDKGYIVATDGNISVRLNSKEILITRTGVCKGELKNSDICSVGVYPQQTKLPRINLGATVAATINKLLPSTEYQFHLEIYKNRPNVNAVIHAHPPYSTVFAVMDRKLNVKLLTETEETLGKIKNIGYYKPGSVELSKAVGKAVVKHDAIILAHHGVVVLGKDLTEARYRLERLEFLAKVTLLVSLFKS